MGLSPERYRDFKSKQSLMDRKKPVTKSVQFVDGKESALFKNSKSVNIGSEELRESAMKNDNYNAIRDSQSSEREVNLLFASS